MTDPVAKMNWILYPLGDITQFFGENPTLYKQLDLRGHNGIDIVRPHGEHIFACEAGIVAKVKDTPDGYGKHVRILSPVTARGEYRDWAYAHLSYIHVQEGEEVKEGQYIGNMGNTGFVVSGNTPFWGHNPYAGTHLHLGVRDVQKSSTGWKYSDDAPRVRTMNYNNGFKGRYDPYPLFNAKNKASTKIALFLSKHINTPPTETEKSFAGLVRLLRKIGL